MCKVICFEDPAIDPMLLEFFEHLGLVTIDESFPQALRTICPNGYILCCGAPFTGSCSVSYLTVKEELIPDDSGFSTLPDTDKIGGLVKQ